MIKCSAWYHESTDRTVVHHDHTDAMSHAKRKHHGPTCLPRFPGLPIGPLCPGTPDCPFGPISPLVGAGRKEAGCKYMVISALYKTADGWCFHSHNSSR